MEHHISDIRFWILGFLILSFGCTQKNKPELVYLDHFEIPAGQTAGDISIGGLSGIDYCFKNNKFYCITDDRSGFNKSHCFVFKIEFSSNQIDTVIVDSVVSIYKNGAFNDSAETVDFESIRLNPEEKGMAIGSEGGNSGKPGIGYYGMDGDLIRNFPIDSMYIKNLRSNKSFESLSFSNDYKYLYYGAETALLSDGDEASLKNGCLVRIMKSRFCSGEVEQQILYQLEKIPRSAEVTPPWKGLGSDNGLSELMALDSTRFLMLERSGAYQKDSTFDYTCRVYLAEIPKSETGKELCTTQKRLLFDFTSLPLKTYNVEGMCVGPVLNGKQTLLFVSDNNFSGDPTVIYLFSIDNL